MRTPKSLSKAKKQKKMVCSVFGKIYGAPICLCFNFNWPLRLCQLKISSDTPVLRQNLTIIGTLILMLPTKMLVTCVTCKIMTCEMISQKDFTLAKTNPLTLIQNLEILGALILMLPTKMSVTCEMITQSWILPLREWGASNVYLSAGQHYLRGKHCRRPIAWWEL